MSTRDQNMADPNSCLNKAAPDEPLFVLRAKDPIAPLVVRIWCSLSQQLQAHPNDKRLDAINIACKMEAWRTEKLLDLEDQTRLQP